MPRTRAVALAASATALAVLSAGPASATADPKIVNPKIVAHFAFAAGQTPENIVLEPDGSADITFALARQVARVTKKGATTVLATFPAVADPQTPVIGAAATMGIARGADGTLYVNYATGTAAENGIWRLPAGGGTPVRIAPLPPEGFPNGLALDESCDTLYAADSVKGTVWRVPTTGGTPVAWATGPALQGIAPPAGVGVGANGIKVHDGAVWVSNTDKQTLVRIPVRADAGRTAGPAETKATGLAWIDDFAFTGHGDTVLAALIIRDELALVRPDGTHKAVLTAKDGLTNPTSVAVQSRTVYVNNSAFFVQQNQAPNLLLARISRHKR
ncbi:hypothetical protein [Streptomyces sp. NPDC056144]|uniref:hypothetical protein n=1 Tax=unclassified Streptomyces TaxID=2593676 RepID=UPI0035E2F89C